MGESGQPARAEKPLSMDLGKSQKGASMILANDQGHQSQPGAGMAATERNK